MNWTDLISFFVGNLSFPIILYLIGKVNPDFVAFTVTLFLEKLFKDRTIRNKVSNAFGVKLIKIGIALITIISDDTEKLKELIERLKKLIEELENMLKEV